MSLKATIHMICLVWTLTSASDIMQSEILGFFFFLFFFLIRVVSQQCANGAADELAPGKNIRSLNEISTKS